MLNIHVLYIYIYLLCTSGTRLKQRFSNKRLMNSSLAKILRAMYNNIISAPPGRPMIESHFSRFCQFLLCIYPFRLSLSSFSFLLSISLPEPEPLAFRQMIMPFVTEGLCDHFFIAPSGIRGMVTEGLWIHNLVPPPSYIASGMELQARMSNPRGPPR